MHLARSFLANRVIRETRRGGITDVIQSEKNVRDQAERQTFPWLQISIGIYKLGYRALGNIKDSSFAMTCLKDTQTSFQGLRLTKPLHNSGGLTLNCSLKEGLWFHRMSTPEEPVVHPPGFIEGEKSAWGAEKTAGPGPRLRAPILALPLPP